MDAVAAPRAIPGILSYDSANHFNLPIFGESAHSKHAIIHACGVNLSKDRKAAPDIFRRRPLVAVGIRLEGAGFRDSNIAGLLGR